MSDNVSSTNGLSDAGVPCLFGSQEESFQVEVRGEIPSDTDMNLRPSDDGSGASDAAATLGQAQTERQNPGEETPTENVYEGLEDTGHFFLDDNNSPSVHVEEEEIEMEEPEEEEAGQFQVREVRGERDQGLDFLKEDQALEAWLSSETTDLPQPRWRILSALRDRQLGSRARFVPEACGSRVFVQRFSLQSVLRGHSGCVNTVHFNQRGNWLVSGSDDLKVIIWDWAHETAITVSESGHRNNIFQAKFLPNCGDTALVTCGRDGQVRLAQLHTALYYWDAEPVAQHRGASHKLALIPDSPSEFLTSGEDAVVYAIDLRQPSPASKVVVTKERDKKVGLYTICVDPANPSQFSVGGRDQFVRIYDQRKINKNDRNGVLKKFCPHHLLHYDSELNVTCLVYNYDGTELLASYNDEDIYLFNSTHCDGSQYSKRYKGHRNNATVKGVNFYGPRSEFVVSGSDCGNIFLWEKSSCQVVQYMYGDRSGTVNCLEPHPYLPVMATSGLDHDAKIWAPTDSAATDLAGLKEVMKKNKRERDEDTTHHTGLFSNHMLWFFMQHLTQRDQDPHWGIPSNAVADSNEASNNSNAFEEEESQEDMQCLQS